MHTNSGKRIKGFLLLLVCLSFIHIYITCYTKCQPGSKCRKIVELIGTNDFVMTKVLCVTDNWQVYLGNRIYFLFQQSKYELEITVASGYTYKFFP